MENNAIAQLNLVSNNGLETTNLQLSSKQYDSLFAVINHCRTSMGRRYLKQQLMNPLVKCQEIQERLSASQILESHWQTLDKLLTGIPDLERLQRRMALDS